LSNTQRIIERLPEFYKTRGNNSLLLQFIDGFGKALGEAEKDVFQIMRGHWVDTAKGSDLDRLGSIFTVNRQTGEEDQPYRRRIKRALQEYKGGGTIEAMRLALRSLLVPHGDMFEILEFPPTPASYEVEVSSGDEWKMSSLGIDSVVPSVNITIESSDAEVRDPRITNKTTGQSIEFEGELKSGQELNLQEGKATLDGHEATERLAFQKIAPIPRYESEWQYTEFLHGRIGVFDKGSFDEAFFATPLAKVKIRFNWTTMKASTVEVRISRKILEKTGIRESEMLRTLNAIKASGVEMRIKILESDQPPEPSATPPPTVSPLPAAPVAVPTASSRRKGSA
jgi:hypothetical protein